MDVRTPGLDELANQSINFTQAATPHPFGPFARAALLTGVESPANGVRTYFDALPREARTIAHELNDREYNTAFFGKWHLAKRDPGVPLVGESHARLVVPVEDRGGFSFWEGFESGFQLNNPWLHGTRLPLPRQFHGYQSDVVSSRAADWINTQGDRPWFCVVSLESPHPPYDQAPQLSAAREDQIQLPPNVPRGGEVEAKARRELIGYYAHISATDRAISRTLARIDLATTAVVFTSAHGDMHGAHGLFRKGWPHEESVRVPLLISIPGQPARRCDHPVSLVQLPSMMLSLIDRGAFSSDKCDWTRISMPSVVELPLQGDRAWYGGRTAHRKVIFNPDGSPWLVFDLEGDPYELTNLAHDRDYTEEISAWRQKIAADNC